MNTHRTPDTEPELEHAAAGIFGSLAADEIDAGASASIHSDIASALASGATSARHRTRFALGGFAMLAPLLAVGAVGAASGSPVVSGPVEMVSNVAESVGIGGNSGDVRNDMENRAEAAGDVGHPGSTPGNTANAPGLAGDDGTGGGSDADEADEPEEEGDAPDAAGGTNPHENGKGCDDVLFAAGEPPFATPGGPVGCDVGASGEHRKNGAKQASDTDEAPDPATDEDAADDAEDGDSQGGVAKGLGHGHDEDPPGNGNGNGHDVHEHEPNENGNGPSKEPPGQASSDSGDSTPGDEPADQGATAPGNSGNEPGKNKNK